MTPIAAAQRPFPGLMVLLGECRFPVSGIRFLKFLDGCREPGLDFWFDPVKSFAGNQKGKVTFGGDGRAAPSAALLLFGGARWPKVGCGVTLKKRYRPKNKNGKVPGALSSTYNNLP